MYNSVETTKIPTNGEPLRILIITGDPHDKQFDYNRSFTNRAWFGYFYRTNYFHTGIEKHLSEHHNVKLSLIRRADEFFESIKTGSEELEGPLDVLIYGFHGRVDAFAMDTREPSRRRMKEIEPYTKIEEVFGAQIAEIFNNYDKIDYHQGLEAIYYYDVLHKAPMFREFFSDGAYVVGNSCSQAKKNTLFSVGNSFALALGLPYFGLDDNSGLAITTSKTGDNIFIHTHRQNTGRLREISPQVITRFW